MNSRALRCFMKVYENKTIAAAAPEVYISPQGLSKIIKQLEYELETELFTRGAQGMEPTESGELLYARARHIIYLLDDIKKEISIASGSQRALNVVVSYSAVSAIPLALLLRFSEEYPAIRTELREYPDEFPIGELFAEEADVGLVVGHQGIPNCVYEEVVPGEVVVVVSRSHRLAVHDEIPLTQLEHQPLAIRSVESGQESRLVSRCLELGFVPNVQYETGNLASLHSLCRSGDIVAVSTSFVEAAYSNEQLKVIRLAEPVSDGVYLVTRTRDVEDRAIALFAEYVRRITAGQAT